MGDMTTLITGATGFIGSRLMHRMNQAHLLCRNPEQARKRFPGARAFPWSTDVPPPAQSLAGVDLVFHLAGESIFAGRWNPEKKQRIRDSRVIGTRNLVDSFTHCATPPKTLVAASAVGFYGDRGDTLLDETAPNGDDFLARVCREWEEEALAASRFGTRVVTVRFGVVLGKNGGALKTMLPAFSMGLGGRLASGDQYMSWIHIDDLVALLLFCAGNEQISGPVNGVSPEPVTNRFFTRTLGRVVRRPAFLHLPAFILRLVLGECSSVLTSSQNVFPQKAIQAGFTYTYPTLDKALRSIFN